VRLAKEICVVEKRGKRGRLSMASAGVEDARARVEWNKGTRMVYPENRW